MDGDVGPILTQQVSVKLMSNRPENPTLQLGPEVKIKLPISLHLTSGCAAHSGPEGTGIQFLGVSVGP